MGEFLPYFAIFYGIGIIAFGLFIRFYLARKRLRENEKILKIGGGEKVAEEMAKKIKEDAEKHRRNRD
ncbi:MAG: hypothetical protein HOD97_05880 [Candidatus Marinimicrobia bacterium]|jgi:hypothetical protein|nr:hypothetical protein [Candidatus Neomarinimicrobiota bacterium]MBT3617481.1 hypothetical protein [Candidatus Neomarinimicrobiota bacterium]MBT3829421.1 hypothetical protein [Candidatus Neomarinimicrobiota bacterium]MBT3996997.1 hypothetical protein [Candidatus Neomarinimicrobiota bacterium]MBT4281123.1 hypothetical protein [Candidatus Neomarinimicrobiota bacterium]